MSFPTDRITHNLEKALYGGTGRYDIPLMDPATPVPAEDLTSREWLGFNYAARCPDPQAHVVHFFIDDHNFERVWKDADRYTRLLGRFHAVLSPDFSLYVDWPDAVNIWNHYRKQWLSCYWQDHGITVIPVLCWTTDPRSYDWCFDGIPAGAQVAVTTIGGFGRGRRDRALLQPWLDGYRAALERLSPTSMIIFGDLPEDPVPLAREGMELIHVPNRRIQHQRTRG